MASEIDGPEDIGIESNQEIVHDSQVYLDSFVSESEAAYDQEEGYNIEDLDFVPTCQLCNQKYINWDEERAIISKHIQLRYLHKTDAIFKM